MFANILDLPIFLKLKQMASRALAFGKHFKLLMQQDQPLIMKMDLSYETVVYFSVFGVEFGVHLFCLVLLLFSLLSCRKTSN